VLPRALVIGPNRENLAACTQPGKARAEQSKGELDAQRMDPSLNCTSSLSGQLRVLPSFPLSSLLPSFFFSHLFVSFFSDLFGLFVELGTELRVYHTSHTASALTFPFFVSDKVWH
jgi:hypothetical protein